MPIIPLSEEEEFVITPVGVTEDDPIVVKFRQATEGDNRKRESEIQGRWWQELDETSEIRRIAIDTALTRHRVAIELYLTLSACNIEVPVIKKGEVVRDDDGNVKTRPLFTFKQASDGTHRVTDSTLKEFTKRLDQIPSQWVDAIHKCCIETNPYWSPIYVKEDEDTSNARRVSAAPGE